MNTPIPPMPTEAAPPGLSEPQRIVNTFFAPGKTFEDIRRNSSWWLPWLLISISSLVFSIVFVHKIDLVRMAREQVEQSSRASTFEQLPPEQREAQLKFVSKFIEINFYLSPLYVLIGILVLAAILMAIFNFIFEAGIPYSRYLAILFYACLPFIVSGLVTALVIAMHPDPNSMNIRNLIATNPAYFMDPSNNKFVYGLLSRIELFRIWIILLLGLGISVNAKKGKVQRGTALAVLFTIYAFVVVIGAAWSAKS
jgi:hypothetical protein